MSKSILPHGDKVPITQAGQPCRHCQTPVVLKQHSQPKRCKPGGYWFAAWLKCPNQQCKALYMLESAKRWYGQMPEKDASDSFSALALTSPPVVPVQHSANGISRKQKRRKRSKEHRNANARSIKKQWRRKGYVEYINSSEWRAFRAGLIAERGRKCEECGACGPVDGHHLTYKRFRHELPEDVKLLCRQCHEAKHKHPPTAHPHDEFQRQAIRNVLL